MGTKLPRGPDRFTLVSREITLASADRFTLVSRISVVSSKPVQIAQRLTWPLCDLGGGKKKQWPLCDLGGGNKKTGPRSA